MGVGMAGKPVPMTRMGIILTPLPRAGLGVAKATLLVIAVNGPGTKRHGMDGETGLRILGIGATECFGD